MNVATRDVFKMLSLRAPEFGHTIDITDYVLTESILINRLSALAINPNVPSVEVLDFVDAHAVVAINDLDIMLLNMAAKKLDEEFSNHAFSKLLDFEVTVNNTQQKFATLSLKPVFNAELIQIWESWIVLTLKQGDQAIIQRCEKLIRAAAIAILATRALKGFAIWQPGEILRLYHAKVVMPRRWRSGRKRRSIKHENQSARLKRVSHSPLSQLNASLDAKKQEMAQLVATAKIRESLHSKTRLAYQHFKSKQSQLTDAALNGREWRRPLKLDNEYFSILDQVLSADEKDELDRILLLNRLPGRFNSLASIEHAIEADKFWYEASDACANIQVWEKQIEEQMPSPSITGLGEENAAIRSFGWGDLTVVREKLIGYDANEIAHIENILPGELRLRETEKTVTQETIEESESINQTESQTELQTAESQALQVQAQKTIQTNYNVGAGVNTSGRYGLTKIDTSLSAEMQRSKSESQHSTTELSKEIMAKAIERTYESLREFRRSTLTSQLRELNRHQIDNAAREGGDNPVSHSGIYLWLEKVVELQLHHYGSRMMIEFHIPEPALSLFEQRNKSTVGDIQKPADFTVGPEQINPANYKCLAKLFKVDGVEPPPSTWVSVAKGWNSMPDEDVDGNKAEDVETLELKIPDGYIPKDAVAAISMQTKNEAIPGGAENKKIFFSVSIGGVMTPLVFPDQNQANNDGGPVNEVFEVEFDKDYLWPESTVPVNFRAHGHFDKTMYVQVTIYCQRSNALYSEWQLGTWEQIKTGHAVLVNNYDQKVRERQFSDAQLFSFDGYSDAQKRAVEMQELQKWAVKIMRRDSFNFNAVEEVHGAAEVSALAADDQAEIVQFFEESFEWQHMSYMLYPYFWGRRGTWNLRLGQEDIDSRHLDFLKAGSCRLVVPVTPGYEQSLLRYLESEDQTDEVARIVAASSAEQSGLNEIPVGTEFEDLWLELLLSKKQNLSRGQGTIKLTQHSNLVSVNPNGLQTWTLSEIDLGREIYIAGNTFTITRIVDIQSFELNDDYQGPSRDHVSYATGSVPYSAPWVVRLPTSQLILQDQREKIISLALSPQ